MRWAGPARVLAGSAVILVVALVASIAPSCGSDLKQQVLDTRPSIASRGNTPPEGTGGGPPGQTAQPAPTGSQPKSSAAPATMPPLRYVHRIVNAFPRGSVSLVLDVTIDSRGVWTRMVRTTTSGQLSQAQVGELGRLLTGDAFAREMTALRAAAASPSPTGPVQTRCTRERKLTTRGTTVDAGCRRYPTVDRVITLIDDYTGG